MLTGFAMGFNFKSYLTNKLILRKAHIKMCLLMRTLYSLIIIMITIISQGNFQTTAVLYVTLGPPMLPDLTILLLT